MSITQRRNSNDSQLLKTSAQIKLDQEKEINSLSSENNFSLHNRKIDK